MEALVRIDFLSDSFSAESCMFLMKLRDRESFEDGLCSRFAFFSFLGLEVLEDEGEES